MSLYISKEELEVLYKEMFPQDEKPSDDILEQAVDDYNGRLDNFANELVDMVCHDIQDGSFE